MQRTFRNALGCALVVFLSTLLCAAQASKSGEQTGQPNPHSSGAQAGTPTETLSPESFQKLANKVRHELVMLPYYDVYDNLYFWIDGRTVTLLGQTPNASTKSSAGNVVKHIEGVDKVINNIEVLPPSPADERIRRATYKAIYSYGPLFKYSHAPVPPIHIIVKSGRITLEGIVDSESDKQMAGIQANQVPGTFQITNNLRVINPTGARKRKRVEQSDSLANDYASAATADAELLFQKCFAPGFPNTAISLSGTLSALRRSLQISIHSWNACLAG